MSFLTRAHIDAEILRKYFSSDGRFEFVGLVAHGYFGSASRVKYTDRNGKTSQFLVKKAFKNPDGLEALNNEKNYLRRLRGAMHIVQTLNIADNPLEISPMIDSTGARLPNIDNQWIVMEWLEYGTIGDFIKKARNRRITQLPNRLLWRLFLCLIRGCIAMAWPPHRIDDEVEIETIDPHAQASNVVHNDLHTGNVLLTEPPLDEEHTISPLVKIIDFGLAGQWTWADGPSSAVQNNIWQMGKMMVALIILWLPWDVSNKGGAVFTKVPGGPEIETDARPILPSTGPSAEYPNLDPDLRTLVCSCLATRHDDRPTISELLDTVLEAVRTRGADFYPGRPEEQDDFISRRWREIVLDTSDGSGEFVVNIS
ncbi:kinase-like protein [Hypoxylon sp. FL1857]|nr:kinase-like protein [Hypoxylon sp. FL1857]